MCCMLFIHRYIYIYIYFVALIIEGKKQQQKLSFFFLACGLQTFLQIKSVTRNIINSTKGKIANNIINKPLRLVEN